MAGAVSSPSIAHRLAAYDTVSLALQGGGALGAYQAGVYEVLDEAGIRPDRLSGISIGALNAAIIAGNPPQRRVARLREFWEAICSSSPAGQWLDGSIVPDAWHEYRDQLSALRTVVAGQAHFFRPRLLPPVSAGLRCDPGQASWYDTAPLRDTLNRLVDFDLLNDDRSPRVVVSAVNVRSGNFTRFDNRRQPLRAEHFMASGALPPGLPPVEIDGEYYWDGGVVSNTPLHDVLRDYPGCDTLVFQVDLWRARGDLPCNIPDVTERQKDIQYSSRTRLFTEFMRDRQEQRRLLHDLMALVPEELHDEAAYRRAEARQETTLTNVIHLIYSNKSSGGYFKDYEFSTASMREHWNSGCNDMRRTLAHPEYLDAPTPEEPFVTHDVHRLRRGGA